MTPGLRPLPGLLAFLLAGTAQATGLGSVLPLVATATPTPVRQVPAAATPVGPISSAATPATAQAAVIVQRDPTAAASPGAAAADMASDSAVAERAIAGAATTPATAPLAQSVRQGGDVFARIKTGLGSDVCSAGGASERWRKRYASNPTAFASRIENILPLLDFVSIEVERVGLPSEFVFIPLVESWYKPDAMGAGGPAGMWQMIGSTARNHGIQIQAGYDGRLSPVQSTRAALSYLKVLSDMFNGWEATVMAYNAGEGRMMQAYKRANSREASGERRRPHGLSNITYDYVAKLQALSCLLSQPERNGVRLPRSARFVPLAPVLMEPGITTLEEFAQRQGRNPAAVKLLNPGYRQGRVVAGVPRLVLMPLGIPQSSPSRGSGLNPDAVPGATAVAQSDDLVTIDLVLAARAAAPKQATLLPASRSVTVEPAARSVPVIEDTEVGAIGPDASMQTVADVEPAPSDPVRTHLVKAGESLWLIARMHQLQVEQIRQWNRLDARAVVHPGQLLELAP